MKKHFICSLLKREATQCLAFGFSHLIYPHHLPPTQTHTRTRPHLLHSLALHSMIAQNAVASDFIHFRFYSILFYFIFVLYMSILAFSLWSLYISCRFFFGGLETITWYYLAQNINKNRTISGIVRFTTFKLFECNLVREN